MSYDWEIDSERKPDCECCKRQRGQYSYDLGSPTYNLGPIFWKASDDVYKQGKKMPLPEASAMFTMMVNRLSAIEYLADDHPDRAPWVALEPENGWGDLAGALRACRNALSAIRHHMSLEAVDFPKWAPLEYDHDPEQDSVLTSDLYFVA